MSIENWELQIQNWQLVWPCRTSDWNLITVINSPAHCLLANLSQILSNSGIWCQRFTSKQPCDFDSVDNNDCSCSHWQLHVVDDRLYVISIQWCCNPTLTNPIIQPIPIKIKMKIKMKMKNKNKNSKRNQDRKFECDTSINLPWSHCNGKPYGISRVFKKSSVSCSWINRDNIKVYLYLYLYLCIWLIKIEFSIIVPDQLTPFFPMQKCIFTSSLGNSFRVSLRWPSQARFVHCSLFTVHYPRFSQRVGALSQSPEQVKVCDSQIGWMGSEEWGVGSGEHERTDDWSSVVRDAKQSGTWNCRTANAVCEVQCHRADKPASWPRE
jgi:hypothetical protein